MPKGNYTALWAVIGENMKVIVVTETILGSGTTTSVYIPEGGDHLTPDARFFEAMKKMWNKDVALFADELILNESYCEPDEAVMTARSRSITYSIHEIKEVA